ncbi:unnamed protein product [Nippostrongylus brasiliensis]|uniref:Uncharacterized protein n=1 Tax=Nippostrongylus brasiliensis TaxID=27835 RepID=A0A0N4XKE5_NIPBR|nr:unnamed protein product [Nippostrongylus brasiliensis]
MPLQLLSKAQPPLNYRTNGAWDDGVGDAVGGTKAPPSKWRMASRIVCRERCAEIDDELNADGADSGPLDADDDANGGGSIGDGVGGKGTAIRGDTSTENNLIGRRNVV